jgi:hypothetical protein
VCCRPCRTAAGWSQGFRNGRTRIVHVPDGVPSARLSVHWTAPAECVHSWTAPAQCARTLLRGCHARSPGRGSVDATGTCRAITVTALGSGPATSLWAPGLVLGINLLFNAAVHVASHSDAARPGRPL